MSPEAPFLDGGGHARVAVDLSGAVCGVGPYAVRQGISEDAGVVLFQGLREGGVVPGSRLRRGRLRVAQGRDGGRAWDCAARSLIRRHMRRVLRPREDRPSVRRIMQTPARDPTRRQQDVPERMRRERCTSGHVAIAWGV